MRTLSGHGKGALPADHFGLDEDPHWEPRWTSPPLSTTYTQSTGQNPRVTIFHLAKGDHFCFAKQSITRAYNGLVEDQICARERFEPAEDKDAFRQSRLNRFVSATGIEYGKYVSTSRGPIRPSPL